jgi:hypothetical protein
MQLNFVLKKSCVRIFVYFIVVTGTELLVLGDTFNFAQTLRSFCTYRMEGSGGALDNTGGAEFDSRSHRRIDVFFVGCY